MSKKFSFLTEYTDPDFYYALHPEWLLSYHNSKLIKMWKQELAMSGSDLLASTNTWESKLDSATTSFWSFFTGIGSGSHSSPSTLNPRNPKIKRNDSNTTIEEAFAYFVFQRYDSKASIANPKKHLIREGIPHKWRNRVWSALTAVDIFLEHNPDVYSICLRKVFHYPLTKPKSVKPSPTKSSTPKTPSQGLSTENQTSKSTDVATSPHPAVIAEADENVSESDSASSSSSSLSSTSLDNPYDFADSSKEKPVSYYPTGNWISKLEESQNPPTPLPQTQPSNSPKLFGSNPSPTSIFAKDNNTKSWNALQYPMHAPCLVNFDDEFPVTTLIDLIGIGGIPHFGGHMAPRAHLMTNRGVEACCRILLAIQTNFPGISYCPPLLHIPQFALLYMDERDAYLFTHNIIATSLIDRFFVNTTIQNHELFIHTFVKLVSSTSNLKSLFNHFQQISFDLEALAHTWLSHFFLTFLPFGIVLMIFDCFISEGYKVLYRFGLGLLIILQPDLLKCKTSADVLKIVNNCHCRFDTLPEKQQLWNVSFKTVSFSRKTTQKYDQISRHDDTMRSLMDITSSVHKTTALSLSRTSSMERKNNSNPSNSLSGSDKSPTISSKSSQSMPSPETHRKTLFGTSTSTDPTNSLLSSLVTSSMQNAASITRHVAMSSKETVRLLNESIDSPTTKSPQSEVTLFPGEDYYDPMNPDDIRHLPVYKRPPFLKKPTDSLVHLLSYEELICLWRWLPDRYYARNAQTVFHTHFHGYNLHTLYEACANNGKTSNAPISGLSRSGAKLTQSITSVVGSTTAARKYKTHEPQILLVRTTKNQIFGAYLSQPFTYTSQHYVGSGESFLFTLRPFGLRYGWARGSNSSFYSGLHNSMDLGGNGLTIDEALKSGVTVPTETFSNGCLTGHPGSIDNFEVLDIEVLRLITK